MVGIGPDGVLGDAAGINLVVRAVSAVSQTQRPPGSGDSDRLLKTPEFVIAGDQRERGNPEILRISMIFWIAAAASQPRDDDRVPFSAVY
jgi:hypothetical protein